MRAGILSLLLFTATLFSQEMYGSSYYKERQGGAIAGLSMRLVGTGIQYGIALPMAIDASDEDVGGIIALDLLGGGLAMAGDITAGVASTRAYRTAYNNLNYDGLKSTWGLFGGGIAIAAVGGIVNIASEGESSAVLFTAVISDILLTAHCIYAVSVSSNTRSTYEKSQKSVSIGVMPVITHKGAGLNAVLFF